MKNEGCRRREITSSSGVNLMDQIKFLPVGHKIVVVCHKVLVSCDSFWWSCEDMDNELLF